VSGHHIRRQADQHRGPGEEFVEHRAERRQPDQTPVGTQRWPADAEAGEWWRLGPWMGLSVRGLKAIQPAVGLCLNCELFPAIQLEQMGCD